MNLKECIENFDSAVSDGDKAIFKTTEKMGLTAFHHGAGRWIRNECNLWRDGTKEIQDGIQKILDTGYEIQAINNLLEQRLKADESDVIDYSLDHPDNASGVILDLYHDYLNGKFDLSLLD